MKNTIIVVKLINVNENPNNDHSIAYIILFKKGDIQSKRLKFIW